MVKWPRGVRVGTPWGGICPRTEEGPGFCGGRFWLPLVPSLSCAHTLTDPFPGQFSTSGFPGLGPFGRVVSSPLLLFPLQFPSLEPCPAGTPICHSITPCNANQILFTLYSSCPLKSLYLMRSGVHLFGFWSTTGSKTKQEIWTELAHNPLPGKSKRQQGR